MIDNLIKFGLPTYNATISTPIPSGATQNIKISSQMPNQIGRIYGLTIYADGVTPLEANPLITSAQATLLYLNLKIGAADYFESVRLSDMLIESTGTVLQRDRPYLPVNLPGETDLSTSSYQNPTNIVSAAPPAKPVTIMLKVWYISTESWNWLLDKKIISTPGF